MIALAHSWHNLSITRKFIAEGSAVTLLVTHANLDAFSFVAPTSCNLTCYCLLFYSRRRGAETLRVRKSYLRVIIQLVLLREKPPGTPSSQQMSPKLCP